MWVFLPAVWAPSHRTWVIDRATQWSTNFRDGEIVERSPWSEALYGEVEADCNDLLGQVGIAPRPVGRLWLLKPPAMFSSVDEAVDELVTSTLHDGSGIEPNCNPEFVNHVERMVASWFGDTAKNG
jgi:hypothetical protein